MGFAGGWEQMGMEGQLHLLSEAQDVARFQGARSGDALAVDKDAVGAAQILDDIPAPAPDEARVPPRHPAILYLDIALSLAAYGDRRCADVESPAGSGAVGYGQGG